MASERVLTLSETLELKRRQGIHRQIGALEATLEALHGKYGAGRALQRIKVKHKIERLHAELNQRMFVEVERPLK